MLQSVIWLVLTYFVCLGVVSLVDWRVRESKREGPNGVEGLLVAATVVPVVVCFLWVVVKVFQNLWPYMIGVKQ